MRDAIEINQWPIGKAKGRLKRPCGDIHNLKKLCQRAGLLQIQRSGLRCKEYGD